MAEVFARAIVRLNRFVQNRAGTICCPQRRECSALGRVNYTKYAWLNTWG